MKLFQVVKPVSILLLLSILSALGCEIMPVCRLKPVLNNPFPQITEVAIVPFFNRTDGAMPSGRDVSLAYENELSKVPGFNVIPRKTVEEAMLKSGLTGFDALDKVENVRKLASILGVEAIVIGEIHDYDSHYPQRLKLEVRWYHVNPYHHYIPVGYPLRWGTKEEEEIPDRIVFLAEHELAREQLKTQAPDYPGANVDEKAVLEKQLNTPKRLKLTEKTAQTPNGIQKVSVLMEVDADTPGALDPGNVSELRQDIYSDNQLLRSGVSHVPNARKMPPWLQDEKSLEFLPTEPPLPRFYYGPDPTAWSDRNPSEEILKSMGPQRPFIGQYPGYPPPADITEEEMKRYGQIDGVIPPIPSMYPMMPGMPIPGQPGRVMGEPERFPGLPIDWPDPRGFIPDGPSEEKPVGRVVNNGPIMRHIAIYDGNDAEFTQALQSWDFTYRDDKRVVSWQSVLHNQQEFIRFCCRMHIWEMLGARGGAGKAETVTKTYKLWYGGVRPY